MIPVIKQRKVKKWKTCNAKSANKRQKQSTKIK